ncbi:MAG: heparin lyase I family protein [Paraglaciecola sp.]|uniref:heparin lyase I family protein n=1 Tax=Paraglaciecola sp. TaxID=1920173 RepID=UPI00329817AB
MDYLKAKSLFNLCALGTFCFIANANAQDAAASVINYYLSNDEETPLKEFLWNTSTAGTVSPTTQNFNTLSSETIGTLNISTHPTEPVKLYSVTDPGFVGPNGEYYGIEIEYGSGDFVRSSGTKSVRYYTDFGQTGITSSGVDRAEIHIRDALEKLDVNEGTTLWLGWSEYYISIDKARSATILQFRNQPTEDILRERGLDEAQISELIDLGIHDDGPASAVELEAIDNQAYFKFAVRKGTPGSWTHADSHLVATPVEIGKWYDFVVKIKYSQGEDGIYQAWFYEANSATYSVSDPPEWSYAGNTMYTYPTGYNIEFGAPQLRMGLYRWATKAKHNPNITDDDRYMSKYLGPLRLWVGEGDEGFDMVKPR